MSTRQQDRALNPPLPSAAVTAAATSVRALSALTPRVGIVLGSGLGAFADHLENATDVPYERVHGMPRSTVAGHAGRFVLGHRPGLNNVPLAVMHGRIHLYEGHPAEQVVLGVRTLVALGARIIILTNAAGGIAERLAPGSLMLLEDHLNLTGQNSLAGPHDPALGPRFIGLSDLYDKRLRDVALDCSARLDTELHSGVYAGLLGPSYETPAEIRMLRTLGADAVGMSTVLEAIAAHHMGASCLAISCITNRAAGLPGSVLDHDDVQRIARATSARFTTLLDAILAKIAASKDDEGT